MFLGRGSWRFATVILFTFGLARAARADTITLRGTVTQSSQDGTGPAINNPSLNNIADLQAYSVSLDFTGVVTSPGVYNLTGSSLTFNVPTAPAIEASFGLISLTITQNAGFAEFSLLGCLLSGTGCFVGNQLDANFKIPIALLNAQNVAAIGLDPPHPLDLLEDDGVMDVHGTIATYSYVSASSAVPEPSSWMLLGSGVIFLAALIRRTSLTR
jgi:hypothetical protein